MKKTVFVATFCLLALALGALVFYSPLGHSAPRGETGTLEKLIVASGEVSMGLDLDVLSDRNRTESKAGRTEIKFEAEPQSFFSIVVFEDSFRDSLPGTLPIRAKSSPELPSRLANSFERLVVERSMPGASYELVVRDGKTGFSFFNIEGHQLDYRSGKRIFTISEGRMLVSKEFASELGRKDLEGTVVGEFGVKVRMRPIEVANIVDGEIISNVLPTVKDPEAGSVPGPDVVVGDVFGLAQFGSNGSQVGLALGTTSCNYGEVNLNWFRLPDNDHPVIPQNLYRMSGGASNSERFEQIGQSSVKHAFTALTQNLCQLGCNGVGGSRLGSGCSDPYSASLNAGPNLGSRAWINPFDGHFPRGDSATSPNNHSLHSHNGISHRILTEISDLSNSQNPGATYWAEGQYITPHEYEWCQNNPGECNMYNNVSYRQYSVNGNGSPFTFSSVGSTVREKSAISAWTGATVVPFEPDPGNDGIGAVGYKVTAVSPGVYHYEYAVYNQNIDRAIQSFSVPLPAGASVSNIGFHAPPQHPGWDKDGTVGDAGFSDQPWTQTQTASEMKWNSETFVQNPNANAIRWGTMYNFRFRSNAPPQQVNATIGFFKNGDPIVVSVMGPAGAVASVSVGGRVTTAAGAPLRQVFVALMDPQGNYFWTLTNTYGYYQLPNVPPGVTYDLIAWSKEHTFTGQEVAVNSNITGLDIVAEP